MLKVFDIEVVCKVDRALIRLAKESTFPSGNRECSKHAQISLARVYRRSDIYITGINHAYIQGITDHSQTSNPHPASQPHKQPQYPLSPPDAP